MVTIRLSRSGVNKRPFYHVVVCDRRFPRDGRFIERLGYFNPMAVEHETRFTINAERLQYWLGNGAKPSERLAGLIKRHAQSAGA